MIKSLAKHFGDKAQATERDLRTYCFGKTKLSSILLALDGQRPVGFAITREWMNFYLGVRFCHIDFLFVEEPDRQAGVASTLIKFIAISAKKSGCRCVSLDVGVKNTSARKLYEKVGFKKRGPISDHYRLLL